MSERRHHRPRFPGAKHFEAIEGDVDPATLSEAADRAATALVRGARDQADQAREPGQPVRRWMERHFAAAYARALIRAKRDTGQRRR